MIFNSPQYNPLQRSMLTDEPQCESLFNLVWELILFCEYSPKYFMKLYNCVFCIFTFFTCSFEAKFVPCCDAFVKFTRHKSITHRLDGDLRNLQNLLKRSLTLINLIQPVQYYTILPHKIQVCLAIHFCHSLTLKRPLE